ncbi:MAG: hypothetical protein K0Q68_691 [Moraxellaceae bacterium]|nr:hypothetical protein [Moraxellaceae bacterium]
MMRGQMMGAVLLACACLPALAQPPVLADADLLYCARAYAEGAALLKADPDPGVRRTGRDALIRAHSLGALDIELLKEDPARHERASAQAQQRLSAMPVVPPKARRLALRAAYLECRYFQAGAGVAPAVVPAVVPAVASTPALVSVPASTSVSEPLPTSPVSAALPASPGSASAASPATTATARAFVPAEVIPDRKSQAPAPVDSTATRTDKTAAAPRHSQPLQTPSVDAPKVAAATVTAPASGAAFSAIAGPGMADPQSSVRVPERLSGDIATETVRPHNPRTEDAAPPAPAPAPTRAPAPIAPSRLTAGTTGPATASGGLGDADMLYCAQVYGEIATVFGEGEGEAAEAARDARERWSALSERDHDLLNDHPGRHSRASTAARTRLAALPEKPGRVRSIALRAAYEECRGLQDRATAGAAPDTGGDRVQMLANRHFCRDMLMRRLRVSPKVRAGFTPNELAALEEIQRIAEALSQPLPGAALTLEQDREANRLTRQLLETLERAAATWSGEGDPIAKAMGQCHDDYAKGLLGGPDVLSPPAEEEAPPAAAPAVPHTPVVRPADIGPVFHMREVTPVGSVAGIWIRRGRSSLYDAVWVQADNGQMQRDVLELRGIVDGELTLYRQGYRGSYRARVGANGMLEPGSAMHMREVTPRGNYEGIWRQRGQTGVYDALWVFLPTGEITSDVLAVSGVAKGQLIIQRLNDPGIYPVKRRAGGTAAGQKTMSRWVVLPAQSVRLGVSR